MHWLLSDIVIPHSNSLNFRCLVIITLFMYCNFYKSGKQHRQTSDSFVNMTWINTQFTLLKQCRWCTVPTWTRSDQITFRPCPDDNVVQRVDYMHPKGKGEETLYNLGATTPRAGPEPPTERADPAKPTPGRTRQETQERQTSKLYKRCYRV